MRTNLISNPSAIGSTTAGWDAIGSVTIGVDDQYAYFGDTSFFVRSTATTASNIGEGMETNNAIVVSPNLTYSFSVFAFVPLHVEGSYETSLQMKLRWVRSNGTTTQTDTSEIVTVLPRDDWADNRISIVRQAPADAVGVYVSVETVYPGEVGREFLLDGFLAELSQYVGEFFNNRTQVQETTLVNRSLTKVPFPHIDGLELNADIAIGDLILNTIDEDGTVWVCTDIEGWWTPSAPETPNITRGTEDGSYDITGRYTARDIVLKGVFLPQDRSFTGKARDKLVGAIDLVRRGAWLKTNEQPTKAARVRLVGRPDINNTTARGRTEFSIPLRAADPVKYLWNDDDIEGVTRFDVTAQESRYTLENEGNATVAGIVTLTGPMAAGASVQAFSKIRDDTLTTAFELRKAGTISTLTAVEVVNNVVTMTTDYISSLIVGDVVSFSGVDSALIPSGGTATVTSVTDTEPYQFTYTHIVADREEETLVGSRVNLVSTDVLNIDTYNQTVTLGDDSTGQRAKLDPLIDWVKIAPGDTIFTFDSANRVYSARVKSYDATTGVATLKLDRAHYMDAGNSVTVALPEETSITTKQIKDVDSVRTAVLTTAEPHGYAVGDLIDVTIVATSDIAYKSVNTSGATPVVTLRTDVGHGVATSDVIIVALPISASVTGKSAATNVVTLVTGSPHGFSVGDSIVVALPTTAFATKKKVDTNFVTLTTATNHGFSTGDAITVALPEDSTIVGKTLGSSTVTLTTSTEHGYSIGDTITVALPETANISNYAFAGAAGGYLVTVTTSAAHGFSIGDNVTIAVSGGGSNTASNGSRYIESIPDTDEFTFLYYGSNTVISSAAAGGTVTNVTNDAINGVRVISQIPTTTTITYAR